MIPSRKKTIVYLMPRFTTGGAERLVLAYAKALRHTYDVHVISTVEDGELRTLFEPYKDIHLCIGSRTHDGGRYGVYKKIVQYIQDIKPDIIHSHLFGADLIAYLLKKQDVFTGTWISTLHNIESHQSLLRQWLWKQIYKSVDHVIAVSKHVAQFGKTSFAIPVSNITTCPNGIPLEQYTRITQVPLGNTPHIHIAIIGRLEIQKGHTYLLDALALCEDIPWSLHIYGDGSQEYNLKQQAQSLGIQSRITWHGVTKDIEKVLSSIDIVIQPSLWEGLSLVIMESMAAGRVVVASEPAAKELIVSGETGFIVKPAQSKELAAMIRYVVTHQEHARQVAFAAKNHAIATFDEEKHINDIQEIYSMYEHKDTYV